MNEYKSYVNELKGYFAGMTVKESIKAYYERKRKQ